MNIEIYSVVVGVILGMMLKRFISAILRAIFTFGLVVTGKI